ncbi:MAG: LbetaH domain-containing protein, partial [Desulfitobacteriaceae bacterium]
VGIGQNKIRKAIYNKFSYLKFPDLIHPSATFGWGQLQEILKHSGNIIAAGVRFTNNITMGDFGIFNYNSTVGHDCVIGDYVNIAPGANISGNVYLAEGCYIGTGAQILQGKSIDNKLAVGAYAVVGAGAVVVKEVPVSVTVKGVPAQI